MLIDFRERRREGESEGEKHQCERETPIGYLSYTLTWDLTHNLDMCRDWELNPRPLGL